MGLLWVEGMLPHRRGRAAAAPGGWRGVRGWGDLELAGGLVEKVDLRINNDHEEPAQLPHLVAETLFLRCVQAAADGLAVGVYRQGQGHLRDCKRRDCCDDDMEELPGQVSIGTLGQD